MRKISLALVYICLASGAQAAPSDDGSTAGARAWTLNQGRSSVAVTPNDGADLAIKPTRALYNGNAAVCNIAVRMADDGVTATTYLSVQPGAFMPIQVNRVMATNTTCTGIVAIY